MSEGAVAAGSVRSGPLAGGARTARQARSGIAVPAGSPSPGRGDLPIAGACAGGWGGGGCRDGRPLCWQKIFSDVLLTNGITWEWGDAWCAAVCTERSEFKQTRKTGPVHLFHKMLKYHTLQRVHQVASDSFNKRDVNAKNIHRACCKLRAEILRANPRHIVL